MRTMRSHMRSLLVSITISYEFSCNIFTWDMYVSSIPLILINPLPHMKTLFLPWKSEKTVSNVDKSKYFFIFKKSCFFRFRCENFKIFCMKFNIQYC